MPKCFISTVRDYRSGTFCSGGGKWFSGSLCVRLYNVPLTIANIWYSICRKWKWNL